MLPEAGSSNLPGCNRQQQLSSLPQGGGTTLFHPEAPNAQIWGGNAKETTNGQMRGAPGNWAGLGEDSS